MITRPIKFQNRIDWLIKRGRTSEAIALTAIEWQFDYENLLDEFEYRILRAEQAIGRALNPILERMAQTLDDLIMKE